MKLVFLGPPGAGKGTQADYVCSKLAIPHISTGDMLRAAMAKGTPTGLKAKAVIEAGQLVSDDIIIEMVKERLNEADCANGYLLDGFPRTVNQAEVLREIANPDKVVDVEVADEKLLARITGRRVCKECKATYHISKLNGATKCPACGGELIQRTDDNPETIKKRLDAYHQQTEPLIDFYKGEGTLVTVNGDDALENVTNAIYAALGV